MERYSRQILFPPIGDTGQRKLADGCVVIVGAGALGTVISNHLVRSGVGKVKIIDRDYVESSNLQRQMLYTEADAEEAKPKAVAARERLSQINKNIEIESITAHVDRENVLDLIRDADVVMDGTDNFSTRYLLNDACFQAGIPFAYGGAVSSRGMSALFIPEETACLQCMMPTSPDGGQTCDTVGVISPVVDIVASQQVTEVLKYLTNNKVALHHSLNSFDIWFNRSYAMKITKPRKNCSTCQLKEFPFLKGKAVHEATVMCGRNTVQIHELNQLNLTEWEEKLSYSMKVTKTPFLLKAELEENIIFVLFPDGRVLVQGTEDVARARSLYDRYIGS